jgi:hypothetical protein
LKCHHPFVDHRAANCPNGFPSPIGYKTLMQVDIDRTKRNHNKPIAAVATSSAISPAPADTSANIQNNASQYHHVAAVMGMSSNPVAYLASNASSVIGNEDSDSGSDKDIVPGVSTALSPLIAANVHEVNPMSLFHVPHLYWRCLMSG